MSRLVLLLALLILLVPQTAVAEQQKSEKAQKTQIRVLKQHVRKSRTVVRWWNNRGEWALAPDRRWCWSFKGERRERVCLSARRSLRSHQWRIAWATRRIDLIQETIRRNWRAPVPAWFRKVFMGCIHEHESTDWYYDGSSGFDGGFQFLPSTWSSNKPSHYPAYAYQATPEQQLWVAWITSGYGRISTILDQWPATSRACGL